MRVSVRDQRVHEPPQGWPATSPGVSHQTLQRFRLRYRESGRSHRADRHVRRPRRGRRSARVDDAEGSSGEPECEPPKRGPRGRPVALAAWSWWVRSRHPRHWRPRATSADARIGHRRRAGASRRAGGLRPRSGQVHARALTAIYGRRISWTIAFGQDKPGRVKASPDAPLLQRPAWTDPELFP
jgi:hypothetical protein